eukprot:4790336-Lingulodinium_polyedra.AAC.1
MPPPRFGWAGGTGRPAGQCPAHGKGRCGVGEERVVALCLGARPGLRRATPRGLDERGSRRVQDVAE